MMAKPIRTVSRIALSNDSVFNSGSGSGSVLSSTPPPALDSTTLAAHVVVLGPVLKVLCNLKRKWTVLGYLDNF